MEMTEEFDVAVVGFGPTGMATAAFLGRQGHRVVVLERYQQLYNLPRAATFDDDTMRAFGRLGIGEKVASFARYRPQYEWRNADGDLLIEFYYAERGKSGWPEWWQMYQPALEDALVDACRDTGRVDIRLGTSVTGYREVEDAVEVDTDRGTFRAAYVVAADGGNSTTRDYVGVELTDYGFAEPWMVCDFKLTEEFRRRGREKLPMAMQVCDPAQPGAIMSLGDRYHRFSFMRRPEQPEQEAHDPDQVWARVSRYLRRGDAELIRVATYTFRSLLATRWRRGRVLLAGDAVHQMPPFLGQGMCSGIRDAQNLAFKIDLILRGRAGDALLDTYETERRPHVEAVILKGVEVGRIQTTRDPTLAAERDRRLLADRKAGRSPEKLRMPVLSGGLLQRAETPGRGDLFPQGWVRTSERGAGRFDDVVGTGFVLLLADGAALDEATRTRAAELVDTVATLGERAVMDLDGVYGAWFREHRAVAVLVRPDCYVYGSAPDVHAVDGLLEELAEALQDTLPPARLQPVGT
jgi:2-polyprenyl-6-methoxyphenol hydroxylase-like FAD-dependent oxidoreductase